MDARTYSASDKTRDGTFVRVRAIQPHDRDRLTESFAEAAIEPDVGLVATVWIEGSEWIVGLAGFFVDPWSEPRSAEAALTVLDLWQGRGIETLLFEHLVRVAGRCGIEDLYRAGSRVDLGRALSPAAAG